MPSKFKAYYWLTKPGIIYGNLLPAVAGYFLAAQSHFKPELFVAAMLGLGLVIASACVFNNYLDREIDAVMDRTKKRALVSGRITTDEALVFGAICGLAGLIILLIFTNLLSAVLAVAGFIDYVILYGYTKRHTPYSTLVGSISGAIPPVVGYTAVTGHIDSAAIILFLILVFWQMPHFYAIGIYRLDDYRAAGLPILPAVRGIQRTKMRIALYMFAFTIATLCLTVFGYTGLVYALIAGVISAWWLWKGLNGLKGTPSVQWARQMFSASLIVLTILCIDIAISRFLP